MVFPFNVNTSGGFIEVVVFSCSLKLQGRDWFRELLLPEVLRLIPQIVAPVRQARGRIAILDGRVRSRGWGAQVFSALEPWTSLHRLLPS